MLTRLFDRTYLNRVCAILLIAFCLLAAFFRLDTVSLYRDEADTALLAEDMVQHHHWVPRYFDGTQLVAHFADGRDFDPRFLAVIPGWLQFYVEAASFKLLGVSTWTARFPFVLAGLVSIFVLWRIGNLLFPGIRALLPALLAASSILSLSAFRQARYYSLVYLFASLLIFEFCRYIRNPDLAKSVWFYMRWGVWAILLYISHWGTFAAMWFALSIFVVLVSDPVLRKRWIVLSAILAVICVPEFVLVHLGYVLHSEAAAPLSFQTLKEIIWNTVPAMWSALPLFGLVPAGIWIWRHRSQLDSGRRRALMLMLCVIVFSLVFSLVLGRAKTEPRYYLQVLPAILLLESLMVFIVVDAGKRRAAILLVAVLLISPDLGFYNSWINECVELQLLAQRTSEDPLIDFLKNNVRRGDTIEVFPNEQGQVVHFYLPQARWVGLLNSKDAANTRYRGVLPPDSFDDYPNVDWFVIWHSPWSVVSAPPMLRTGRFTKVWEYDFWHHVSIWNKLLGPLLHFDRHRLDGFEVWKRTTVQSVGLDHHSSSPRQPASSSQGTGKT